MLKRILTALVGLLVFFAVVFAHRFVLYIAITLVILGMLLEMYRMMDEEKPLSMIGLIVGLFISWGCVTNNRVFVTLVSCMIYGATMIALHGKIDSKKVMSSAFITMFISLFMGTLISIRKLDRFIILLPFVCAWLSDTGAYFIGSLMGRNPLCKNISPKKTIEGAVAGLIFSALGSIGFIAVMTGFSPNIYAIVKFGLIGLCTGILSQIGDLVFSCIKRDCGKKDYGSILPGHGGILDRFDSVLFVAPFVFYIIQYVIK
ncbi:MAG: hypothetical protein E7417_04940 [Ruminococcaceae bacterium]|nr:hypothetical protein [Oscillospiraceae bacterium]